MFLMTQLKFHKCYAPIYKTFPKLSIPDEKRPNGEHLHITVLRIKETTAILNR